MRRIVVCTIVVGLLMGTLTACNQAELGYWNMKRDMARMAMTKPMETVFELQCKVDGLPQATIDDFSPEDLETYQIMTRLLNNNTLVLEAKQDLKKDIQIVKISLRQTGTRQLTPLYEMSRINKINYIKVYPWQDIVARLVPELGRVNELSLPKYMQGYDYLSISDNEMQELLQSDSSSLVPQLLDYNLQSQLTTMEPFLNIYDDLFNEAYKGYEMRVVSNNGNSYTTKIATADVGRIAREWVFFTLDNAERIADVMHTSLKKVPATAYAAFMAGVTLTEEEKNVQIDMAFAQIKPQLQNASSLKELALEVMDPVIMELEKNFGGSSLQMTESMGTGLSYSNEFQLIIDYKEDGETAVIETSGTATTRFDAPFGVAKPQGKILSMSEAAKLAPRSIYLDVDGQLGHVSQGPKDAEFEVALRLENGAYYLTVLDLGILLDTRAAKTADGTSLLHRAKTYPLAIVNFEGVDYVKVKDLQQLGFKVTWLQELRTIQLYEENIE